MRARRASLATPIDVYEQTQCDQNANAEPSEFRRAFAGRGLGEAIDSAEVLGQIDSSSLVPGNSYTDMLPVGIK